MLLQAEVGGRGQAGEMREPSVLNLPREGRGIGCRGGGRQWTECGRNREAWVEAVAWMVGTQVVWQLVPCSIHLWPAGYGYFAYHVDGERGCA